MSHEISYDAEIDCVILRIQGKVTIGLIHELAPQVARMLEENNCRRLLNDMSATTIDLSVVELYTSPQVMDESRVLHNTKRALVVPPSFDEGEFLENATRNRGHDLRVLKNIEEAKKWLLSE